MLILILKINNNFITLRAIKIGVDAHKNKYIINIMTITEKRNEKLSARIIKNLAKRHITAYYCATSKEAISKALELMPEGSTISWGGSMTIRDMGLVNAMHDSKKYKLLDRDLVNTPQEAGEIYIKAFGADFYISSANAISEDGVIVNIDGNGNRVAAITFGPKNVLFLIGMNKVCQDVDAALKRARSTASPINCARFNKNTPCQIDGSCHNCNSVDCICNYIHFLRNSPQGKHQVILVGENLGY